MGDLFGKAPDNSAQVRALQKERDAQDAEATRLSQESTAKARSAATKGRRSLLGNGELGTGNTLLG